MPFQFKGFVLRRILLKIKFLLIIITGLLALVGEACARNAESSVVSLRLSKLATNELPLPYDDVLVPKIKSFQSKPLSADFLKYEQFFETELSQRNMPQGIKYLPVALSSMQRKYTNGDRCGIWAMPTLVALRYGLEVDDNQDERFSVEASTKAVLDYLCDLHEQYQNWWFCILAYTNSPTALHHALMKSDKYLDLWDLYHQNLLPDSNIISDFIACFYVYSSEDRVIAEPVVEEPETKPNTLAIDETKPAETKQPVEKKKSDKQEVKTQKYIIKKGDTLTKIAHKYHVSINDLKKWNHLKSDKIREGQKLIIKKRQ